MVTMSLREDRRSARERDRRSKRSVRDRNQVVESQDEGENVFDECSTTEAGVGDGEVPHLMSGKMIAKGAADRTPDRESEEDGEKEEDLNVDHAFHGRTFDWCSTAKCLW